MEKQYLIRGFLRGNKDEAMRYSELKKTIVSEGIKDLLEASKRKAGFIEEILKKVNIYKAKAGE